MAGHVRSKAGETEQRSESRGSGDPFASCGAEFDFPHMECVDLDGAGADASMFAPTTIHLEDSTIEDVKQALLSRMERMEQNMTFMMKRVFTEVIALRKENAILKTKVQEALSRNPPPTATPHTTKITPTTETTPAAASSQPAGRTTRQSSVRGVETLLKCEIEDDSIFEPSLSSPVRREPRSSLRKFIPPEPRPQLTRRDLRNYVIPTLPFMLEDEVLKFEQSIGEDVEKEQRLVDELSAINCTNPEKYIRLCWRKLLTDQAAERFCWRGTATKKSIRDFSITIALQTAFQQKYVDDGVFERVTRKYFLYAHDRIVKQQAYRTKLKSS